MRATLFFGKGRCAGHATLTTTSCTTSRLAFPINPLVNGMMASGRSCQDVRLRGVKSRHITFTMVAFYA